VVNQKERKRRSRNLIVTACTLLVALQHTANADTLWYELERGSELDLTYGGSTRLHGKLALMGCGETGAEQNPERDYFSVHALLLDEEHEELEFQLNNGSQVPLFGGPGVGVSGRRGSIQARSGGNVSDFQWFLRHSLCWERAGEAALLRRDLTLDVSQSSSLDFADPADACPESIELHLLLEDVTTIYQAEEREFPPGEWVTSAKVVFGGQSRELVGRVTLYAREIPGSEEKLREPIRMRRSPLGEAAHEPTHLRVAPLGEAAHEPARLRLAPNREAPWTRADVHGE